MKREVKGTATSKRLGNTDLRHSQFCVYRPDRRAGSVTDCTVSRSDSMSLFVSIAARLSQRKVNTSEVCWHVQDVLPQRKCWGILRSCVSDIRHGQERVYRFQGEFILLFNVLLTVFHGTSVQWNQRDAFFIQFIKNCGPGSSVGIAAGYGLDGPGIESRWGWDFPHLSRLALGSTQPPVQWLPVLYGA
jgi:hypothetical protein